MRIWKQGCAKINIISLAFVDYEDSYAKIKNHHSPKEWSCLSKKGDAWALEGRNQARIFAEKKTLKTLL